jgi:hypothetical protein
VEAAEVEAAEVEAAEVAEVEVEVEAAEVEAEVEVCCFATTAAESHRDASVQTVGQPIERRVPVRYRLDSAKRSPAISTVSVLH